ncbi:MAG: flagellar motor protein MotD [Synergistetes bacterium ADurb.BinA166]|nr:MAG: flagellar motor protein MotD [Synergistetes bacterium ADurb.BinA166]
MRADAVKAWLMEQSSTNFPDTRFTIVAHGQNDPVASNATEEGRSKNRRVVIVLGTSGPQ